MCDVIDSVGAEGYTRGYSGSKLYVKHAAGRVVDWEVAASAHWAQVWGQGGD
jgi:hypothetical protein